MSAFWGNYGEDVGIMGNSCMSHALCGGTMGNNEDDVGIVALTVPQSEGLWGTIRTLWEQL